MKNPSQSKTNLKQADIIVGIPSYNEADTIPFVAHQADLGLQKYFKDMKGVIINVDNNSPDNTKSAFLKTKTKTQKIYISTPPGIKGKGNNFLNLFKKARELKAKIVIVVDADLKSITPEWIEKLGKSIEFGHDYATPNYVRNEYDGTITNHICYPLIYGLLGINIRQPIGGDFACSGKLTQHYLDQKWNKSITQYGIDIFMTLNAIFGGFKIVQVSLGSKIHKPSAPKLNEMSSQVMETLFKILLANKDKWPKKEIKKITTPCRVGKTVTGKPQGLSLDYKYIKAEALDDFSRHYKTLEKYLSRNIYNKLSDMYFFKKRLTINADLWSKVLYSMLKIYEKQGQKACIIESLKPLYFGRNLSFIMETLDMDFRESEEKIVKQAETFWKNRNIMFS